MHKLERNDKDVSEIMKNVHFSHLLEEQWQLQPFSTLDKFEVWRKKKLFNEIEIPIKKNQELFFL